MSTSTAKMLKVAKEVAEDYSSSLSDLTVNSKPLINMLTMLAEENIVHAPIIVQAVERHLQKVRAEIKLPVLYLIDSIVKNVGGQYTLLFTQNIVSTFCSVFEKVDERTRAQMFKLRQTWNEVFPPKKLYAMDVRVNSIDPAWPITALPPTTNIHVNPKFIRAPGQVPVPNTVPAVVPSVAATPAPTVAVSATTTIVEDSHALNEKSMREELLRKQKELLELQQKKLELELLQTKAKLEEQQKQLERQTGHLHAEHIQNMLLPSLQTVAQETATKLLATAKVETPIVTQKIQTSVSTSAPVIGSSQSSSTVTAAVSEATVAAPAVASARVSSGVSGSSKVKTEGTGGVKTSVSAGSRPSSTPTITTTAPSVRSRDPRLASRQPQPVVVPVNNTSQLQDDDEMEEPDSVFEPVKLETAKPKPQITINLGCANKGTMNKETRGISKKDPRLMSNKVQGLSNSNIKGRTSSAPSIEVGGKGGSKLRKGPSPVPSSPSRTGSSGVGKTSTSPSSSSISSPRRTLNKSGSNGSVKALRMKPIPKLSQAIPKLKHEVTDSPPTKTEVKEEVVSNKEKEKEITKTDVICKTPSPSSKTENHKKKSSPVGISKSSPDKKKSGSGKPESVGTGGNDVINSIKKERVKSPAGGEKKHGRERSDQDRPSMIFDMFGDSSESDSPSPPPPPVISTDSKKKEEPSPSKGSMFKDVKGSKSRNYVRRNQHSKSRSPEISPVTTTGDVDLRLGAPPEKHPRLNMFQSDIKPLSSPPEEDVKNQPLVEAANKDIDLRQLPGSPGKKRPSMERAEQPPLKKTKAEVFDELFGNEDVDLRQLPPAVVKPVLPPSPPPPPVISQPSPIPTSSSSQDSMATISLSPKRPSPERERDRKVTEDHIDETKLVSEDNVKENEGGLNLRGWAKYKELKPDTYKSPLRPLGPFGHELDLPKSQSSTPGSNSPLREREIMFSTPRGMAHFRTSKFDRLGRPLLYDRLPDDPMERRRSLSTSLGEDTDMRPHMLEDVDDIDINIEMIVQQADEQLKNGTISFPQYNTLLKQVIHLNEVQKLREAQRRDLLENKENWERSRRRRLGGVAPVDRSQLSPISLDDDSQDGSSIEGRYGDIDDRFPASHKPRSSAPPPAPSPPDASMMGGNKFQTNMPHWSEMRRPQMPPSQWEPLPHTWLRGDHAPSPQGPMVRMFHSTPTQVQGPGPYRPPGPEFQPMNNFGGMNRWRPPQFQNRPPFEGPMDRFEPRFAVRPEPRFRVSAPLPQPQQPPPMPQQPPQLQPMPPHPQPMQPQLQMMPQQPQSLPQRPHSDELPPADPMILDLIAQDTMRTINIDGVPREIRFYGDTAVALLSWDDPREICFQGGSRRVWFDDREAVNCSFNEGYRDFILDGSPHRIQLGSPTRELYIDGKWYECFFSGPPITIEIGGKMHNVKLEGPPPHVKIDNVKRTDLVAGKINLIINARTRVPVFLDAKPQRFDIEGKPHVLRFVEALNTVLINGRPLKIEFGGLPIPIIVYGKKHFIRFTVLPQGIKPGYIKIMNMEGGQLSSPPRLENENSNSMGFGGDDSNDGPAKFPQGHEPALPVLGGRGTRGARRPFAAERDRDSPQEPEHARNSPTQLPAEKTVVAPAVPVQQPRQRTQGQLPLEMLTSLMPSVMAPASGFSYQVDQDSQDGQQRPQQEVSAAVVPAGVPETSVPTTGTTTIPFLPTEINVDELFQKLVATGIVPQADKAAADSKKEEEEVRSIKNVDFKQPETMKVRQPGVVALLYSGIQCSSCGVRFPPEQTMKYSQHLDWHFRQNRRDRDNTRKAQSRKWYYDVSDWIQFEEIEDLEERAQSWFETQQAAEGEEKEVQEVPSVCAGENPEDTFCAVCHDKFEQFYNEEREEWHLRAAVRIDGKTYHPLCYEDYKASLEMSTEEAPATEDTKEEEKEQVEEEEEKKEEEKKADEETKEDAKVEESNVEAMDTSVPDDTIEKEPPADGDDAKVEEGDSEKVGDIENQLKDVKLEPGEDETSQNEEAEASAEGKDPEAEVKTEPEEKETEEGAGEEGVAVAPTVDTTHAAVACSIDGNVQFEDSPQITTGSSMPGKIKINISKSLPASATKEPPSEAEPEASTAEQGPDNDSGPVPTEASRESGEEGTGEEEVASQEPPPPGVEPVQLKPRLMGRKLTELPPVMKGTELSGLCSIM